MIRAVLAAAIALWVSQAEAVEFRQARGEAIRARFAGMAFTDHVHWRFVFRRDGSLPSTALGRDRMGSWRVTGDQLCMKNGVGIAECYAVWIAEQRVQLRPDNDALPTEEGELEKP